MPVATVPLKKKWLWLASLLPLLFVSDILYGSMKLYGVDFAISPGIVLRGLVVAIAIYMVLTKRKLVGKGLFLWIITVVTTASPAMVLGLVYGQSFFYDLSSFSKVVYLPLVAGLFVVLVRRYYLDWDDVLRFVEYAAYVLGLSLLLSQVLGLERWTYGDYAFGSTGIFYAQNDMTLALGLAILAGAYRLVAASFAWSRLVLLGMSAFACIQIGTRASLVVIAGTAVSVVIWALWGRGVRRMKYLGSVVKWIISLLFVAAMSLVLLYGWSRQQEFSYQQQKLQQIAEGKFPRLLLVEAGGQHISERSALFNLFGEGADSFQRGVARYYPTYHERRMVEVDWMDIFGSYGFIFAIVIYLFVFMVFFKSSHRFVTQRDTRYGLIGAATMLYIGNSVLAGHALVSPIPSTLMSAYFALFFIGQSEQDRRYSSVGRSQSNVYG